jgi:peptidoglycan-N-acetylglucosamine deacetylase
LPLKSYLLMVLYILAGGSAVLVLGFRFFRALHRKALISKIREGVLLAIAIGLILFLCGELLPCFNLFESAFCRASSKDKWVALSFDDGPNEPYTSQILDILKENKVPATFFLVGKNVGRYPDVVRRIQEEGHLIGNHTDDHSPLLLMGPQGIRREIEDWEAAVSRVGVSHAPLFRAPHGWKSPFLPSILREKGYRLIGWTRGVWDSDQPGTEILYDRLTEDISPGEIILLHDGKDSKAGADRRQTVEVLPRMIRFYKDQGFRFVTLTEMAGDPS